MEAPNLEESRPGFPVPIGHYSNVVELDSGLVLLSGQKAWHPGRGTEIEGDMSTQVGQIFRNIGSLLASVGLGLDSIVRITCCLANIEDYAEFDSAYSRCLGKHRPARVSLGGYALRGGALVELVVEAYRGATDFALR